MKEKLGTL